MKQIWVLVILLFLWGCKNGGDFPKAKIAHLYVDVLVAEETYKTKPDSMKIEVDSLYKFYGIDEQKYLEQLKKYKYNEKTWDEFFKEAEKYLDTLKAREKRRK